MSTEITREDHVLGPDNAQLSLLGYGDYQCPYSARGWAVVDDLRAQLGERMRFAYRHLPLSQLHPFAEPAAEAAEAAAAQGKFWEMHTALYANQDDLSPETLLALAQEIGLDIEQFQKDLQQRRFRPRVEKDLAQAGRDGAEQTPTFFINGKKYEGDSDAASLSAALEAALSGG